MARNGTSITGFISDVADSVKDLADDVLARARDLERDVRNSVGGAIAHDGTAEKTTRTVTKG